MVTTLAAAVAVASGLITWLGGADVLLEMWLAAGMCLLAASLAILPAGRAGGDADRFGPAALSGSVIRLIVTPLLVIPCGLLLADVSIKALGLWALAWYLLLMVVEVALVVRYLRMVDQVMKERAA